MGKRVDTSDTGDRMREMMLDVTRDILDFASPKSEAAARTRHTDKHDHTKGAG